jgi:LAS superfamily LD-carboxypeptidase LdcB
MRRRSPAVVGILAVLVLSIVAFGQSAEAASSVDRLRSQRRAIQQKRAAQASQLNVLKANDQQVGAALDALSENRKATASLVAAARQRTAAEQARAAEAKAAEARTTSQLGNLRNAVRDAALDEFMRGHKAEADVAPDPNSPMETARRRSLLQAAVGSSTDAADRLQSAKEDLQIERKTAETAAASAAAEQQKVEQHLAELEAATKQQQAVADQVEARLERALAEADSLASLDGTLASQIKREQDAIASRLRSSPGSGKARSGGSRRVGNISLTTVRGITVASSIGSKLASLLNAADSGGLSFSGGGYRDSSQQVATRRNNCGSSDYDIYNKPASSCSPPTARPGQSMHEQGLAIDFTANGRILTRSSAGYRWLKANASRFGFYNLPSEPWHWSVNGD